MEQGLERSWRRRAQRRVERLDNWPVWFWGLLTGAVFWRLYVAPSLQERRGPGAPLRAAPEPQPASEPQAPAPDQAPDEGAEDDLTRINGIGPANARRLKEAGIDGYRKLAAAQFEDLAGVVRGVPRHVVQTWREQARLAARGDWDGVDACWAEARARRRADTV
jgi:predicted flap endonuclease-1-like 5' DNA nuclease